MTDESKKPDTPSFVRRLVCENSKFHIYFDDVESPDGSIIRDYLVVAPKVRTDNLITGIAVLPVVDGRVGLLRIFRHPIEDYSWEVPRGFIDPGEDAATSALRELEEETGLQCEHSDLVSLGYVTPEAGVIAARLHCYAATRCVAGRAFVPGELGHREFRLFEPAELGEMIRAGAIQDPCTLLSCFRYFELADNATMSGR